MYHSARAITFASFGGDDHERHNILPRNLPHDIAERGRLEIQLTEARLLRNQADYDPYPQSSTAWRADAQSLSATSAKFVQACEEYALEKGYL